MFGYVIPNQDELKGKELKEYRAWYCGLCHCLQDKYGLKGRVSLNYEMTFLAMLLGALYEPETDSKVGGCVMHPLRKQKSYSCSYIEYAADMNILLTYYKCLDNWQDDRSVLSAAYAGTLRRSWKKVLEKYPQKAEQIRSALQSLSKAEEQQSSELDLTAGCFGDLCRAVFAYRQDEWSIELERFGFYLGKFIYILDAWDDRERDEKKGVYNPILVRMHSEWCGLSERELRERVRDILKLQISESCRVYERLPIVDNVGIFRNVLYSGVWTRFEQGQRNASS